MDQNLISQNLNIFKFLQADNLSEAEKTEKLLKIQKMVLESFLIEDLPGLLDEQKLGEFSPLLDEVPLNLEKIFSFLKQNCPDFEKVLQRRTLLVKKDLVLTNLYFLEKAKPDDQNLKQAIAAVQSDHWQEAEQLL